MVGSSLPPGFRFHPTDEELVGYYLQRKNVGLEIELEVIPLIDLYKFDPWELPEKSFLPNRDMEWFFFCPRDKKYPNGSRTNRATKSGYWKATGKDRKVDCQSSSSSFPSSVIGYRKTLVFYRGRAPLGYRTEWVMHEYRLCDDFSQVSQNLKGAFALCRVVKRNEQTQKKRESNEPLSVSAEISCQRSYLQNLGEVSCQTSHPQNESHHSSPVVSPYPYEVTVPMASVYSKSGSSNIWVSPDFILESSKGYLQAEESSFQYFTLHDNLPSLTQFEYSEFYANPSYLNFNWKFEDSKEFYMNDDVVNYEIYNQAGSMSYLNSFSYSPGQNSF